MDLALTWLRCGLPIEQGLLPNGVWAQSADICICHVVCVAHVAQYKVLREATELVVYLEYASLLIFSHSPSLRVWVPTLPADLFLRKMPRYILLPFIGGYLYRIYKHQLLLAIHLELLISYTIEIGEVQQIFDKLKCV